MSDPLDPYDGRPAAMPPAPQYQQYQQYQPYPPYGPYPQSPPYAPYPPGYPAHPVRPASVTGAAVLAMVLAGLLMLAGIVLFAGVSFVNALNHAFGHSHDTPAGELAADGVVNVATAALLLAGGVQLLGGRAVGRTLTWIGCALVPAESVYWVVRPGDVGSTIGLALVFAALALVAAGLLITGTARAWLTPASGT